MSDSFIPLSTPSINGNEWKYIKECLDTEWVSSVGKYVDHFEQMICDYTRAENAVACVNGTSALKVSLQVAGCKSGDEVIVPTVTFIAPVNAVCYLNAKPVFMDCDEYYTMDIDKTINFINEETIFKKGFSYNKRSGRRIIAIIPVHVFGNAVNLEPLINICKDLNIKIIEDAAESVGTYYNKGKLMAKYSGNIGDIGCYSFNGNKIITSGGGGMIVTNNQDYANRIRYLTTQAKDDSLYYIHDEVGYNFRLPNIQAALGLAQLEKLDEFILKKKKTYDIYKRSIDNISGLHLAEVPDYAKSNYWFYSLQININEYGRDRDNMLFYLKDKGVQARPIWYLNHLQKPFKKCQNYKIEKAYSMINNTINIPCSVGLTNKEIESVIKVLKDGKK